VASCENTTALDAQNSGDIFCFFAKLFLNKKVNFKGLMFYSCLLVLKSKSLVHVPNFLRKKFDVIFSFFSFYLYVSVYVFHQTIFFIHGQIFFPHKIIIQWLYIAYNTSLKS